MMWRVKDAICEIRTQRDFYKKEERGIEMLESAIEHSVDTGTIPLSMSGFMRIL